MTASRRDNANSLTGDSGPGTGIKDLLPIPEANPADPTQAQNGTTFSHALANDDHEQKGHIQIHGEDDEIEDLGWNEKKEDIAAPLVGGMDNEELWLLLRRFNKQVYHLKATNYPVPGGLDLNTADDEEFSPDKLRANLERLYTTVGIGVLAAVKHIARLRSWREARRTSAFATAYFIAWLLDIITPMFLATLIALIVHPPAREFLFPPAPVSLVDSKTGGVQKPKSGVLGSHDSATGAPENHKGEAVEQEASNFVSGIASVALSSAAGKHPQGDPDSDDEDASAAAPDPTAVALGAADAKEKSNGSKPGAKHDKTKVPMETMMWTNMRPIMHALGDLTDTWERFANALSPTPPFPRETQRMRLAGVIVPIFGVSLFVTSYMFTKAITFFIGFGFFGDPVISRGFDWLNRTIPDWQKLLELRNTLLKGVPTNAQLTITLLRLSEANHAPIPPPPHISSPPPSRPASITDNDLRATGAEPPLNASPSELDAAIAHDPDHKHKTGGEDIDAARNTHHGKKGNRLLNFFRGTTKGAVQTAIGTDTVRAKALGSRHAKDRLGAVPPRNDEVPISGPVEFKARFEGKKGYVYLSTAATAPAVGFCVGEPGTVTIAGKEREDLKPLWSLAVSDIVEVKKIGGYGWKAKLVVGWSMEREVKDGLEIVTMSGEKHKITAVPLRDELFNRLVAMGAQKWEAW